MLFLEDEALDVVLEIDDTEIAKYDGVDTTINGLNKLLKKDSNITKYQALEVFQTFRSSIKYLSDWVLQNSLRNWIIWCYTIKWYIRVQTAQIS